MEYPLQTAVIEQLQKFQQRLHAAPFEESVEKTPDGKAKTVVISHIEMTLDELFFGQWRTENFKWSAITNEVQGSLELVVVHPVTGFEIRRVGAASIVITVDKVPDEIKYDPQLRNRWALSPENKKPNALDLAFPKLKAECLKNAAQSLGQVFGRDLNRGNTDEYKPFKISAQTTGLNALPTSTMQIIKQQIEDGLDPWSFQQTLETVRDIITPEQRTEIQTMFHEKNPNL